MDDARAPRLPVWALARIYAFLVLTRLLRRLPPRRLPALLEPRRPPAVRDERRAAAVAAAVDDLLARGGLLVPRGCLPRGLALFYFLRRAGVDVTLAFGVGSANGEPAAHCWLVRDGRPYLEKTDPRSLFATVWTIEPRAHAVAR